MLRNILAAAICATLMPGIALAAPGFVTGSTEIHAGPDYGYPTLDIVRDGEPVEIIGCLDDMSWCDVGYRDDRGWIPTENLVAEYEYVRQPVMEIAPFIGLTMTFFSFDDYWDRHYHSRPFYRERGNWHRYTRQHRHDNWDRGDQRRWERRLAEQRRAHEPGRARHDDHRRPQNAEPNRNRDRERHEMQQRRQQQEQQRVRDAQRHEQQQDMRQRQREAMVQQQRVAERAQQTQRRDDSRRNQEQGRNRDRIREGGGGHNHGRRERRRD